MSRAARLADRRRRVRDRTVALAVVVAVVLTFAGLAWGAVSQVNEMTVCVAANGSVSQFNPYEGDCPGSTQEVVWAVHGPAPTAPPTTAMTSTSTTTPTSTPTGNGKPPAGGYFSVLAPGSALPSEASCAAQVHHSRWEPRPDNTTANHTAPSHLPLGPFSQWNSTWASTYQPRIDGNYFGTTDELFQYEACKWGWSDELVRAQAIVESNWHQSQVGDNSTSYGILQVRYLYHPRVQNGCKACAGSSWPDSQNSTPFNIDEQLSEMRGCVDGMSTYLGNTTGDVWDCIGSWYSGAWKDSGSQAYQGWVRTALANKPWLQSGF